MEEHVGRQEFNGHKLAVARTETSETDVVIFCHGFKGTSIGPSRLFVRIARLLATQNISSVRFDQYGSGNSDGEFLDSSFADWVATTEAIVRSHLQQGYRVALFGQSMGASTAIVTAANIPELSGCVAWVPGSNVGETLPAFDQILEEEGQIFRGQFWREASDARIAERLRSVKSPMYIVQCTADKYVNQQNRDAISASAQPNHTVDIMDGYPHSDWTFEQSEVVIQRSFRFLERSLS